MIRNKGFTMIELFISIIAIILMMGIVTFLFRTYTETGFKDEEKIELQKDARLAIQRISKDLRRAHEAAYASSRLTIACFRGKPTLGFPNLGSKAAATETVAYFLDGNKLMYENSSTQKKELIAENVKQFNVFIYDDYIALKLEAEADVILERQKYDKVSSTIMTKVYPRYLAQSKKYKGYFSSVDEDGTY